MANVAQNHVDLSIRVWRTAVTTGMLGVVGDGIIAAVFWSRIREASWYFMVAAVVSAVCLCVLLATRGWRTAWSRTFALVVIAVTLWAEGTTNWILAERGLNVGAFDAFKIVALGVATIVPFGPRLSYAVIGTCAAAPIVEYYAMPYPLREALSVDEPWSTVVFATLATGILMHRLRDMRLEQEMARARAEKSAIEGFAMLFLAYRDLANSPLQAIELTKELLRTEYPEAEHLAERLDRSLARLRKIAQMLAAHEASVEWTSAHESFDASDLIRQYHDEAERRLGAR